MAAAKFFSACLLIAVSMCSAHPAALTCMTEMNNTLKVGGMMMGMNVTADVGGPIKLSATTTGGDPTTKFTPGTPVMIKMAGLPPAAYMAIRASNSVGMFGQLSMGVITTPNCPSQLFNPVPPGSPPPNPPSGFTAQYTAPKDVKEDSITFNLVYSMGPSSFNKLVTMTLEKATANSTD
eukprot:m.331937 g.331937  ORF g.331937 m.331937 type:complete len:179 (+) comp16821_c0_seq1:222-758(+)